MNFLGVGPFEILLVLVIATIVLGPERMAEAGRTLGRLYAQYRHRWQRDVDELTRELRRELTVLQQELEEIRQTAEDEIQTVQATVQDVMDTEIDLDAPLPASPTPEEPLPPSGDTEETPPVRAIEPPEPATTEIEADEVEK
jgi:Sec-independent protein translocase protein TatA